jgi:6-phosphogluconolactonase
MRLLSLICSHLLLLTLSNRGIMDRAWGATNVDPYIVYVGTYTVRGSQGIYAYRFDSSSGRLVFTGLKAKILNPSFLAIHNNGRLLYAVSEVGDYKGLRSGAIRAYRINRKTAALTLLNEKSSGGPGPCYISLDTSGKYVLVANYQGGSITVLPLLEDGSLRAASAFVQHHGSSVNPTRQNAPHAHSITTSPDKRFAIAADLGLDKLFIYRFDTANGSLVANNPPSAATLPGVGPRHLVFHPGGHVVYVIDEMASAVSMFSYDGRNGTLVPEQTISTLPQGFSGHNEAADIHIDSRGKFLYASNRGFDTISVFAVDAASGRLTLIAEVPSGGKTPRNFAIDPNDKYLIVANEDSDTIVTFAIDPKTGTLHATANVAKLPSPVYVGFLSHR